MMLLLAESPFAPWGFAAGCALLTWILLKRSYKYFGKPRGKRLIQGIEEQHRPTSEWDGAKSDAMARIERREVEMQEMTRDLKGELNSKIIILEKLIADSQRQIERMEELIEKAEQKETSDSL